MGWTTCVNPFNNHGNSVLFATKTISADFQLKCDVMLGRGVLSEGQQLCDKWYSTIRHYNDNLNKLRSRDMNEFMDVDQMPLDGVIDETEDLTQRTSTISQSSSCSTTIPSSQGSISVEDAQNTFDACLRSLYIPLIESNLSKPQRNAELKRRFVAIMDEVKKIVECLSEQSMTMELNN